MEWNKVAQRFYETGAKDQFSIPIRWYRGECYSYLQFVERRFSSPSFWNETTPDNSFSPMEITSLLFFIYFIINFITYRLGGYSWGKTLPHQDKKKQRK